MSAVACARPHLWGDSGAVTDLLTVPPGVEVVLKPAGASASVDGFEFSLV